MGNSRLEAALRPLHTALHPPPLRPQPPKRSRRAIASESQRRFAVLDVWPPRSFTTVLVQKVERKKTKEENLFRDVFNLTRRCFQFIHLFFFSHTSNQKCDK